MSGLSPLSIKKPALFDVLSLFPILEDERGFLPLLRRVSSCNFVFSSVVAAFEHDFLRGALLEAVQVQSLLFLQASKDYALPARAFSFSLPGFSWRRRLYTPRHPSGLRSPLDRASSPAKVGFLALSLLHLIVLAYV